MALDVGAQNQFSAIFSQTNQLLNLLGTLNILQDKFAQDATLAARTATQAQNAGYTLVTADYTNWAAAVNQLLFAYNSGNPTQKSFLYKVT